MVKIFETFDGVGPAMMNSLHVDNELARLLAYVTGLVKPTAVTAEPAPERGKRKPHSASSAAQASAVDRSAEMYAGGDREMARPQGAGASRVRGETGDDSGMVSTTDRAEV